MNARTNPVVVLLALLFCATFALLALPLSLWRAFRTQLRK